MAHGDCAAVQYSGAGGRDPLFLAQDFIPVIEKEIAPRYEGLEITSFRELADIVDKMVSPTTGKVYHTANPLRHYTSLLGCSGQESTQTHG